MWIKLLLTALTLIWLTACGQGESSESANPDQEPDFSGYVLKQDSERLLVVASEPKNFSDTGGIEEFYAAIWISGAPDNIEIGHKVDVWIDGPIMESYPAQATAQKMAVKVSPKLEEANLYEHEAIQKALQGQEFHEQAIVTVIAVEYDAELKNWTVQFKRTDSLDKVTIEVDDE